MITAKLLLVVLPLLILLASGCRSSLPQPPAGAQRFTYRASEQEVDAFRTEGESLPRVVYVHGSPGDATSWNAFLEDPIPGLQAVSIDRPGFGGSDFGLVKSLREQAGAIEPLLEARQGEWPLLVGHSLGGPIIARAAADHPQRVGGLVIVAGSLDPELERLAWYNYFAYGIGWILPRAIRRSNQEMWDLRPELEELAASLQRIECPVVIVHGHKDSLVPFGNVDFMQRSLTNARSVEVIDLPHDGHMLLWSKGGERAIRDAIEMLLAKR